MLERKTIKRCLVIMIVLFFAFSLVAVTLFRLQILGYDGYQDAVIEQLTVENNVNPSRGIIYDTNGNILASNQTVWILYLLPKNIENPEWIAENLSDILGIDGETILEKAKKKTYKYQVVSKTLKESEMIKVREFISQNGLEEQIELSASTKRYYPFGTLCSHALGFTNVDGIGIYGLEKIYNNILEGTNGKYITAQDAKSQDMPFQYEEYVEEENSYSIVSTIDLYIQYQLEAQLKDAYVESGGQNRACGIVMNPQTGEVLAMATYPAFDCNDPYALDADSLQKLSQYKEGSTEYKNEYLNLMFSMWNNKAVTELYEPGSTFKLFTTSVALQEKVASLSSTFFCSGALKIDGYYRAISCHKRTGHGTLTFAEALQQSCNPSMMTLASRIGRERFYEYFCKFGYTGKTGIDLPSEQGGYYHDFEQFSGVSLAVYSFGQTFKTTPIQQLRGISVIANGGYLVTPHLLKSIVDQEGNVIYEYETQKSEQIIDTDICNTISQILKEGVDGAGGAKNAYVAGYSICAKTGTSEKKDKYDANGNTSYRVSSTIAYAPSEDAQVAVIMLVDEPSVGTAYGSVVVAPYISKLLELILPYMGVEPNYSESDLENQQIAVQNYIGKDLKSAVSELKKEGVSYEIIGNGEKILRQIPLANSKIRKKDGKILLYTDNESLPADVIVPDCVGKTAEEANLLLAKYGLNIQIHGNQNYQVGQTPKIVSQLPMAGETVNRGSVVTLSLIYTDETE